MTNTNEEDLFDIELDNAATPSDRSGAAGKRKFSSGDREDGKPNLKRQKKDNKYGFGGKKRHAKSNDAISSADTRGFNPKKMKAGGAQKRLGKNRRAKRN